MSGGDPGEEEVGYGRPPRATRFRKGRSGNPGGRPRGRRNEIPYDAALGQIVMIREDGVERRVTAAEAFLLRLAKTGLEGDGASARQAMAAIEDARARRIIVDDDHAISTIILVPVTPGGVRPALEPLRMGRKLDRLRDTARVLLEPWIVEAALARPGATRLSRQEQEIVVKATRTPWKVKWPEWWRAVTPEREPSGS